jgi:hypothetical protein
MELANECYPWDSDDGISEDGRPNIMMQEDNYIHHTTSFLKPRSTNEESSSKFNDEDVKNTRRGIIDLMRIYEECFPSTIDDDSTRNKVDDVNTHINNNNSNNNSNNNTGNNINSGNNGKDNIIDIDSFESKNAEESNPDPMELESAENKKKDNDIGSFDCSDDVYDGETAIINSKKNPETVARSGSSFDSYDSAESMSSIPAVNDTVNDDSIGTVIVPDYSKMNDHDVGTSKKNAASILLQEVRFNVEFHTHKLGLDISIGGIEDKVKLIVTSVANRYKNIIYPGDILISVGCIQLLNNIKIKSVGDALKIIGSLTERPLTIRFERNQQHQHQQQHQQQPYGGGGTTTNSEQRPTTAITIQLETKEPSLSTTVAFGGGGGRGGGQRGREESTMSPS